MSGAATFSTTALSMDDIMKYFIKRKKLEREIEERERKKIERERK
jgi:hypothetical protein